MNSPQDPAEQNANHSNALFGDDELSKLLQYHSPLLDDDFAKNTINEIMKTEHKRQIILTLFSFLGVAFFCLLIEPAFLFNVTHALATRVGENLSFIMIGLTMSMGVWIVGKETDFI
jgi:hypothetical protein